MNKTEVFLRLSSDMIDNADDETSFPHELLLFNRLLSILLKAFAIKSSTDIKLWKIQLSKIIQSEGFLCRLLGPLPKTGLPLMNNVTKPLVKSNLIPLGLTASATAEDAVIYQKALRVWINKTNNIKWWNGRHY